MGRTYFQFLTYREEVKPKSIIQETKAELLCLSPLACLSYRLLIYKMWKLKYLITKALSSPRVYGFISLLPPSVQFSSVHLLSHV